MAVGGAMPRGGAALPEDRTSKGFSMPKSASPTTVAGAESAGKRIDLMFKAFSDRTRLRLLNLLLGGERCVGDLVAALDAPQPRVSRHLAYLRRAGLVNVRKAGLWKFYSLAPPQGLFHERLLHCIRECFGHVPELRADVERLHAAGPCCDASGKRSKTRRDG